MNYELLGHKYYVWWILVISIAATSEGAKISKH